MSKPRAINIFLNDGDPEGLRSAQISLSTILAIAFRKLQLKAARAAFPELDRPGVYILLGVDEAQPDQALAYIGESESVAKRLQHHASSASKGFWRETIALVSKDENLTKSHARYVEARLLAEAGANPAWKVDNTQNAAETGKLPLAERAIMDEFIDQLKILVGVLGCELFMVVAGPFTATMGETPGGASAPDAIPEFSYTGKGFSGRLVVTLEGELVLRRGSVARGATVPSLSKSVMKLRDDLVKTGALVSEGEGLRAVTDIKFTSPSAASAALSGMSVNGRAAWKLANGQTFADWEAAQSAAPLSDADAEDRDEA
ncbi:MAG: GIY-YIG nuclease family protein [Phenylobacterium sp.]